MYCCLITSLMTNIGYLVDYYHWDSWLICCAGSPADNWWQVFSFLLLYVRTDFGAG